MERFNTVMIEADEDKYLEQLCKNKLVLWFARVYLFLKANIIPDTKIECSCHQKMPCKNCGFIHSPKMRFV